MPPARYLARKSPGNESSVLKLFEVIVPSNVTLARLVQRKKAPFSILVTLFGMVTLVRLVQREKAPLSMLVTLFGMVTLVRLVQF
jgi:hypothetical protein